MKLCWLLWPWESIGMCAAITWWVLDGILLVPVATEAKQFSSDMHPLEPTKYPLQPLYHNSSALSISSMVLCAWLIRDHSSFGGENALEQWIGHIASWMRFCLLDWCWIGVGEMGNMLEPALVQRFSPT
jgi:hypothetical protein